MKRENILSLHLYYGTNRITISIRASLAMSRPAQGGFPLRHSLHNTRTPSRHYPFNPLYHNSIRKH